MRYETWKQEGHIHLLSLLKIWLSRHWNGVLITLKHKRRCKFFPCMENWNSTNEKQKWSAAALEKESQLNSKSGKGRSLRMEGGYLKNAFLVLELIFFIWPCYWQRARKSDPDCHYECCQGQLHIYPNCQQLNWSVTLWREKWCDFNSRGLLQIFYTLHLIPTLETCLRNPILKF